MKSINKNIFSCLIFQLLITLSIQALKPSNVEFAINCGGPEYTSQSGIRYRKDGFFEGGNTADLGKTFEIELTKDKELYQTERWSSEDFYYKIPISSQGKYVLILKFSEVYFNNPGEKVFDVAIGSQVVLNDLDIFSKVGKAVAYDEYIEFEIKKNILYIKGQEVKDGYEPESQQLIIKFIKKEKDNPKINAILLVKGSLDETDFEDNSSKIEQFASRRNDKDKKQRDIQRISKNIDYVDFEDDFVDDGKKYAANNAIFSLGSILVYVLIGGISYYIFFIKGKK